MRWEDERYVRVYTRDTLTWRMLGWQGRSVFLMLLRKVDRAGVFEIGSTAPAEALSLTLEVPLDLADAGWRAMAATGCVALDSGRIVVPNFLEAQETPSSDKARQRKSREMARVTKRDITAENSHAAGYSVTSGHAVSHGVTPNLAVPSLAVPCLTELQKPPPTATPPAQVLVKPKRSQPTEEQSKCRKAIADAFQTAYFKRSGSDFHWQARHRAAVAAWATHCGDNLEQSLRMLSEFESRAESDAFLAKNFSPNFISARLNELSLPLPARTGTNGGPQQRFRSVHFTNTDPVGDPNVKRFIRP